MEISRSFFESSVAGISKRVFVFEIEVPVVAVAVVFDQVHVNIEIIGAQHRCKALQFFAGAVPGWNGAFLVFGAEIVIVEQIVAARERSG